jgi:hypothetical protein
VAEWGAVPEYQASLERALGAAAAGLEADVAARLPAFRVAATRINENLEAIVNGAAHV